MIYVYVDTFIHTQYRWFKAQGLQWNQGTGMQVLTSWKSISNQSFHAKFPSKKSIKIHLLYKSSFKRISILFPLQKPSKTNGSNRKTHRYSTIPHPPQGTSKGRDRYPSECPWPTTNLIVATSALVRLQVPQTSHRFFGSNRNPNHNGNLTTQFRPKRNNQPSGDLG